MNFKYEDWSDLTVTFGVVAYVFKSTSQVMHLHSQVELCIVERGSVNVVVDGTELTITQGSGILICPHITHRFKMLDDGSEASFFIFSTEFLTDFKVFFESSKVPYVKMDKDSCPEFALAQIKYLVDFAHSYGVGKTVVKGMLTVLVSGMMPAYSGGEFEKYAGRSNNFEMCRQLLMYIDNNIASDLSLERISKALNIVPSYVSSVFSRNFDISLNTYISKKRISAAKSMLIGSPKTITEIAFGSGFSSIRSFNRRFKESEGMTPSEYRESFMKSGDHNKKNEEED